MEAVILLPLLAFWEINIKLNVGASQILKDSMCVKPENFTACKKN